MKSTLVLTLILVFAIAAGPAAAEENEVDIPTNSTLIIKHAGQFIIIADQNVKGLKFKIEGQDRKGKPVTGHFIELKPYKDGHLLVIKKKAGHPGISGKSKVTLYVNPAISIRLPSGEGNYSIKGLSGHVEVKLDTGNLTLEQCSGQVAITLNKGNIKVKDHRSQVYPFSLNAKKGNVSVEIGKIQKSAPGKINMKEGRVTWKMVEPVALNFYGEVKEGLVTCNLPIQNQEKNLVQFTSLSGHNSWEVLITKGMLSVTLPKPKKEAESMWGY